MREGLYVRYSEKERVRERESEKECEREGVCARKSARVSV